MLDDGWPVGGIARRLRVITDNDYRGDPDGLIELAHQLLSPNVEVRAVIGSHLRHGWDPSPEAAVAAPRTVLELTGRTDVRVVSGSDTGLADPRTATASDAVDAIVTEAMRNDVEAPLFVTCGAGLTALASAWLVEPRIGSRLTLIWIGGSEHHGHAEPPPGEGPLEYNLAIDPIAAQVVFNHSDMDIWQVPRNVYRTVIASRAELLVRMGSHHATVPRSSDERLGLLCGRGRPGRALGEQCEGLPSWLQHSPSRRSPVTLTATVKSLRPATGTVAFHDRDTLLAEVAVTDGQASYQLPANLDAGAHRLSATFLPANDGTLTSSTSRTVTVLVARTHR